MTSAIMHQRFYADSVSKIRAIIIPLVNWSIAILRYCSERDDLDVSDVHVTSRHTGIVCDIGLSFNELHHNSHDGVVLPSRQAMLCQFC